MRDSIYTPVHAAAASAVLLLAVSKNYWTNFIHGAAATPPRVPVLLFSIGCQVAFFGLLALFIWAAARFRRASFETKAAPVTPPDRRRAVRTALVAFPAICLLTFGIEWVSVTLFEFFSGITPAQQDLITWLKPETYPLWVRLLLMGTVVFEAPLLEEPLFRGILFRGFAKSLPDWFAMALSGFIFAAIHVNAATFVPLWYLGVAFAWLYRRTGSILAPMTAHALFNGTNLILCLFFPEAAA